MARVRASSYFSGLHVHTRRLLNLEYDPVRDNVLEGP
jgi:hypothetical protein